MRAYIVNVRAALVNWIVQSFISFDQAVGVLVLGLFKVLGAIATGARQMPVWADETLSAHCWRAAQAGKPAAEFFLPIVDFFFLWQGPDLEVDLAAGRHVRGHCEKAWWKERLRRNSPPEHR